MNTSATSQEAVDAIVRNAAPPQGCWRDSDYLWLVDHLTRLLEITDGHIEELPMPTRTHQLVLWFLTCVFKRFVEPQGGIVLFAPFPLRIRAGKYREPDLLMLLDATDARNADAYWTGADLVLEIASPDDPSRDYVVKRTDYAEAGIPEYWIIDPRPRAQTATVLTLRDDSYIEHGSYTRGDIATSALLDGFRVDVESVFESARSTGDSRPGPD